MTEGLAPERARNDGLPERLALDAVTHLRAERMIVFQSSSVKGECPVTLYLDDMNISPEFADDYAAGIRQCVVAAVRAALDEAATVALNVGAEFGYDESPSLCASQIAAAIEALKT